MSHHCRRSAEIDEDIEDLFRAESPKLFRAAFVAMRGDRGMAEDLVQVVFESLVKAWLEVKPRDEEGRRRWLFRVLKNKEIDNWRHQARNQTILDPELLDCFLLENFSPEAGEIALDNVCNEQLWQHLRCLSPMQYRVIYLLYKLGFTNAEAADALGIATVTVRVHKANAITRLRDLGGEFYSQTIDDGGVGDGA